MKARFFKILTALFCFLSISLQADVTDKSTQETFPSTVSFDHGGTSYQLKATGVATRKKFFIKIYSVAHYLQDTAAFNSSDKIQEILSDKFAKQLTIKWVRAVPADKVVEGYQESFKTAIPPQEYASLQEDIQKYIAFFKQEVKKGDEHVLRWIPGGTIEVVINGNQAGTISNEAFAKGLWNIWFGSKSVVDKEALISLMR